MAKPKGLIEDPSTSPRSVLAFFIAAVLGMGFIVLAKLSALSQVQVTAIPVAILVAYALVLLRWRRFSLRDDQAGDNLYYLGFLYTLTSIAVSLYQFSLAEDSQEHIITNFGIAIATTIIGLALRVMFNQMRQDPGEVERVARAELAEASRLLRREIDSVVMELNVFHRTAQQSSLDSQRTLHDRVAETLKRSSYAFSESVAGLADRISTLSRSTAEADAALAEIDKRLELLRIPELLTEIKTLTGEIHKAHADQAEKLGATAGAIEMAASTMRDSARMISDRANQPAGMDQRRPWTRAVDWVARRLQS